MTEELRLFYSVHLSVAMTTAQTDETQTSYGSTRAPSSPRGADFIFQCTVVIIGIAGAASNALILYAMIASKPHKKQLLIFNQNVFDLCSCLFLVITYVLKLCNLYLTGTLGYWLCMLLLSENLRWCSLNGGVINLLSLTIERYLKVVHRARSKKFLRKWVVYSAIAFAWIGAIIYNMSIVFSTSTVIDGVCYGYVNWKSRVAAIVVGIWHFVTFFLIVVFGLVFCYWRILVVIRRQAKVMAGHSTAGSTITTATQTKSNPAQLNVTKTMLLVCLFFVVSYVPDAVYYLLVNLGVNLPLSGSVYYFATAMVFLYICTNPFVYAVKFDPVRRVLQQLISRKNSSVQSAENDNTTAGRS